MRVYSFLLSVCLHLVLAYYLGGSVPLVVQEEAVVVPVLVATMPVEPMLVEPMIDTLPSAVVDEQIWKKQLETDIAALPTAVVSTPTYPSHAIVAPDAHALDHYIAMLRARIYRFVLVPQVPMNVFVQYRVVQNNKGQVLSVQLVHSSGVPAYDDAVHRAILLASPLPLPQESGFFQKELMISFYPQEK